MSECMTQEDAERMDASQAVQILKPLRTMMLDRYGCPISEVYLALGKAIEALEQPTVDAVPVVRCEKCRKGIKAHGISDGWVLCTKPYVTDTVGAMMHPNDWFCADGERRT